jgi:hypothetical protein
MPMVGVMPDLPPFPSRLQKTMAASYDLLTALYHHSRRSRALRLDDGVVRLAVVTASSPLPALMLSPALSLFCASWFTGYIVHDLRCRGLLQICERFVAYKPSAGRHRRQGGAPCSFGCGGREW